MSLKELSDIGVEDLQAQAESIRSWNELIYSGAADHKGSQAQFMALPAKTSRS